MPDRGAFHGDYELSGKSRGANTAKKVGGGAAVGAVWGDCGRRKRRGRRSRLVRWGGTAVQVATKGEQVHVPSETLLEFSLNQPVTMPVSQAR